MHACVSQGTFSSFYYFKHVCVCLKALFLNLKVVYLKTLIVLVIGKAQFRRAMLSCDSSCLETIADSDLKVSRSIHLIEYMKICEY